MLLSILGVLLGCAGSKGGTSYTLHLTPVTSSWQNPFEGVDQLDLVLTPPSGDPLRVSLGAPGSGSTAQVNDLPPLEDARIVVEGYSNGELVMRGRTEPITASSGEVDATVFVARAETATWFTGLSEGLSEPLLAPLGDGRFWLAGGVSNNQRTGEARNGTDTVQLLTLAPPEDGLGFVTTGTLPPYLDADGQTQTERMGATVTPLTVAGNDASKLLVMGGAPTSPFLYNGQVTASISLYDPAADTWEDLPQDSELRNGRAQHLAIENLLGNVVIWGGLGRVDSGGVLLPGAVEFYDRAARAVIELEATDVGHLDATAANLGSDGTLLCGGAYLAGEGWSSTAACVRVPIDGSTVETFEDLPVGLAGAAMVTLEDGRLLLTGGAAVTAEVEQETDVEALDSAWLYNPETGEWGALSASMTLARAGHTMAVLPDGRVLIAGGAGSYNPFTAPTDPVSCLEIYDPEAGTFTSVNGCDASDDAGGMQGRVFAPAMAVDPDYGAIIVGGLDANGSASANVSLFVPAQ